MFEHVRVYGLTNRPAGYAQVPRGWERVEERTPQFRHGTVRYDHALPLNELYSFEMTPVYRDEAEACEALLAAVAEQKQRTLEQVKAKLRDIIALYDAEADPSLPPSYPLHTLATQFQSATQVWPLGQYTAADLLPTMREILRPAAAPRAEAAPFRLTFDDGARRPARRAKRNGAPSQPFTGVVGGWAITMGGYQITVIDGEEYLTQFGGSALRVRRGSVVEFTVGPVPEGWRLPTATILRVTGEVPMPELPPFRVGRVGRRTYLVTRQLAPGLRVLYEAWEPATVDKVSLRHRAVFSRSHGVVAGAGPDGTLGPALYESRDGGYASPIQGPASSWWGKVTSRRGPDGHPGDRKALEAEAVAAIQAAYGADWRAVEGQQGGTVVAFDGPAAPRRAKPNSALAERSRDWQTFEVVTDEDGDTRERGRWHTDTTPPRLTRGHAHEPETVEATRTASRVVAQSYRLANGESAWPRHLGGGNFGIAYRLETDDGPRVVKLAAATNVHGRPWTREEQTRNLLHEAGVANELSRLGFRCMPRTVFVRFAGGTPALVREYGEPAGPLTGPEYGALEEELVAIEREHGWGVHDELSLYRRADGSVFVGDVGFWQAPRPLLPGEKRRPWKAFDSSLHGLLGRAQTEHKVPDVTPLPRLLSIGAHLDRDDVTAPSEMAAGTAEDLVEDVAVREAVGIPTSKEVARLVALAREVMRAFGRPSKFSERAREARRAQAAKG